MKVKLVDIINSRDAVIRLSQLSLPVKAAYRLQKILKKIDSELRDFHDMNARIAKKYGTEKDGRIEFDDDGRAAYEKEYAELIDSEVELDIVQFPVDLLGDVRVTAGDLMLCDYIFTEIEPA